jgi:23S rRNA (cytosine1962-C5)-methyltransferase
MKKMENGRVVIRKRGADRIRRGHVWVYQTDLINKDALPGSIVSVQDERGVVMGKAI